jgi:hypothetical protein
VTISDQNGTDTISISVLPAKLQGKVRYFAAKANGTAGPPYFHIGEAEQAKALARRLHLPLAWMGSMPSFMDSDESGDEAEFTRMAVATLQGRAVVILFNGDTEIGQVPGNVHHQGISVKDDGELSSGANYIMPKIIFSSPDVSQLWGRVSHTQMKAKGKDAITAALDAIDNDPGDQAILAGQTPPPAVSGNSTSGSTSPTPPPTQASTPDPSRVDPDDQ